VHGDAEERANAARATELSLCTHGGGATPSDLKTDARRGRFALALWATLRPAASGPRGSRSALAPRPLGRCWWVGEQSARETEVRLSESHRGSLGSRPGSPWGCEGPSALHGAQEARSHPCGPTWAAWHEPLLSGSLRASPLARTGPTGPPKSTQTKVCISAPFWISACIAIARHSTSPCSKHTTQSLVAV
jgi:hypothetical protein